MPLPERLTFRLDLIKLIREYIDDVETGDHHAKSEAKKVSLRIQF